VRAQGGKSRRPLRAPSCWLLQLLLCIGQLDLDGGEHTKCGRNRRLWQVGALACGGRHLLRRCRQWSQQRSSDEGASRGPWAPRTGGAAGSPAVALTPAHVLKPCWVPSAQFTPHYCTLPQLDASLVGRVRGHHQCCGTRDAGFRFCVQATFLACTCLRPCGCTGDLAAAALLQGCEIARNAFPYTVAKATARYG
jgi:hypothetical protein